MPDAPLIMVVVDAERAARAAAGAITDRLAESIIETLAGGGADAERLRAAPNLAAFDPTPAQNSAADPARWIHAFIANVDDYPLDDLGERRVAQTNGWVVNAEPVAEQALAYLLAFERRLHRVDAMRNCVV